MAVLFFGLEAVVGRHPPQHVLDAAGAGVADSGGVGAVHDDFLVLGADPPLRAGLTAFLEVADQIVLLLEQLTHESTRPAGAVSIPPSVRESFCRTARASSPLPEWERIEGEGPCPARIFRA